jgi:TolB protein
MKRLRPHLVFWLLVFSIATPFLYGDSLNMDSKPIVVRLDVESSLKPLYVAPLINDDAEFPDSYLKRLEQVLSFDLSQNGSTSLFGKTDALNEHVSSVPYDQFGSLSEWKSERVAYVVKTRFKEKLFFVTILNVESKSTKNLGSVPLTGVLSDDRRQVHKVADAIHRALFDEDGIASTKILYAIKIQNDKGKYCSEIFESDYDGANARRLTNEGDYCISPVYIPPKPGCVAGGFMYVSYKIGQPKIYLKSFRDGIDRRLSDLKGNQLTPAISAQRDKIAFISDVTGNPDLFIQAFSPESGAIGKPYQVFSAKQATQGSPTFSPDGKRLAFVSNKDGSPRIYVLDIPPPGAGMKNVKVKLISGRNRENTAPCWSPDSTKLAYCARSGGDRQIWVYDFTTNTEKQLSQGPGNKENPFWAPNSLHLIFNSTDKNTGELYIMNLNQSEAFQITRGAGEKSFPAWGPRG